MTMTYQSHKQELQAKFESLLVKYNLSDWKVRFGTSEELGSSVHGECRYNSKTIVIKNRREPESFLISTMLHEIAHALTPGDGAGHTTAWGNMYGKLLKENGYR